MGGQSLGRYNMLVKCVCSMRLILVRVRVCDGVSQPDQMNDLSQVPVPVMLLPDDFRANTKIKVTNHLFNKYSDQIRQHPGIHTHTLFMRLRVLITSCRTLRNRNEDNNALKHETDHTKSCYEEFYTLNKSKRSQKW